MVLEAVKGERSVSELATEYGVQPPAMFYLTATQTDQQMQAPIKSPGKLSQDQEVAQNTLS